MRNIELGGAASAPVPAGPATVTLATAFALGVAGDVLLRAGPPGLGLGLWVAGILLALELLSRRHGIDWRLEHWLLALPALFFAESLAWRAADTLGVLNLMATAVAIAVLSLSLASGERWSAADARIADYLHACVHAARIAATHVLPLAVDASAEDGERQGERRRTSSAVARGLFFALPLLLVFGALLSSADPVFARLLAETIAIDFGTVISHLLLAGVLTWGLGGWLRGTLLVPAPAPRAVAPGATRFSVGIVETTTVLGAVNLLFLAFVLVQLRYLFGGGALVQVTPGLSYADYARRGFFELVFVALLTLPMLLGTHAFLQRERERDARTWRLLAGVTLALLAVIVASALQRMRLYVSAYGLTDDRLYALAFMGWLGVVFALFAATVLRDRVRRFAIGTLASGWGVLVLLNFANPDALIARVNLSRADAAEKLDGVYLGALGADALPVILPRLTSLPEDRQCAIAQAVLRRFVDEPEGDWRSWNRSRARARRLASTHLAALRAADRGCARRRLEARAAQRQVEHSPARPPADAVTPPGASATSDVTTARPTGAGEAAPRPRD